MEFPRVWTTRSPKKHPDRTAPLLNSNVTGILVMDRPTVFRQQDVFLE